MKTILKTTVASQNLRATWGGGGDIGGTISSLIQNCLNGYGLFNGGGGGGGWGGNSGGGGWGGNTGGNAGGNTGGGW
ncbi:hypothetical protein SPRG_04349 [Saprolegnia parasitica CBS 223.65]|uniref:Uncharacterized protein n=1 Tax=Saprolegnia parasitica (strain CBS 223.65) TaxID=695850 RepID=A0A067CUH5_SAPPC|nr:hypothetical protein SPRG_04348 [Saprolegnia parasitica CBS 223.65]XP_012198669.1 hypothetical protein SPRG_04349 [Saprolegnia parasitica CBS 223.65]KDO30446.1 hypothetical protein SPRG_04348 [Saprolegnia parasitica CBS 223.65]KDO30447.1 hypothetical protein SPRG_04349 [Saprolegnia parasitica CBS 223.65]|eukprot:XP_012198668.1 hypothetical protein SPRG_04348 [Saprolegnia parasitica CBS 223.65]